MGALATAFRGALGLRQTLPVEVEKATPCYLTTRTEATIDAVWRGRLVTFGSFLRAAT